MVTPVDIKDVKFQGTLCVEMHELNDQLPFVGTLEAYFPNPPHVDLDLQVHGSGEIPGVRTLSVNCVNDAIASVCVLPNTLYTNVRNPGMKPPIKAPAGVLRLSVLRARHLIAGDMAITFVSDEKSDAYAYARLGAQTKQTKVITSFDPEWLEKFDFVVQDMAQWVDLEVFDSDIKADDTLGAVFQKETVLGGGTDVISRGMPVLAMCRKIWNADDRNREYINLELSEKTKDEGLSIDSDPYKGARVTFEGGGKYDKRPVTKGDEPPGGIELEDGCVIDYGEEGVVESIDNTTAKFATFMCSFPGAEDVPLHAGDLKVLKPLIVYKMDQLVGKDGEKSTIQVHPEWLAMENPGPIAAQLVTLELEGISGLPTLSDRDIGIPYRVRITLQDPTEPTETWPVTESKPGQPEMCSDTSLQSFMQTIQKMDGKGTSHEDIAKVLEITPELVQEGLDLFAPAPVVEKREGEVVEVLLKAYGKKKDAGIAFSLYKGENVTDTRKRLRDRLTTPVGHTVKLTLDGKTVEPSADQLTAGAVLEHKAILSGPMHSWLSRSHAHINKVRSSSSPYFHQTIHMVTPSPENPTLMFEILASDGTVLGMTQSKPQSTGYPSSFEVAVEKEASGGWGFGMGAAEGYKYTCKIDCQICMDPLRMKS